MKTSKIRLLATIITLAAVTTISISSATAQRRSTGKQTSGSRVKKSGDSRKSTVQKKSTFKDYDKVERTPRNNTLTKNRSIQRKSGPVTHRSTNQPSNKTTATRSRYSNRGSSTQTANRVPYKKRSITTNRTMPNSRESSNHRNSISTNQRVQKKPEPVSTNRGRTAYSSSRDSKSQQTDRRQLSSSANYSRRGISTSASSRSKYRINRDDRHYKPNNEYRGSSKTWSNSNRPNKMNYNSNSAKFYNKYNYNRYKHWDRSWERYSWNYNSWRDYYYGYNPYSYRFNKYYYHNSFYGDVIRRFISPPLVFVHNNRRYYSYNGHFFNYYRGVGYVLVELPYGFEFDYMPSGYERVYINGYLYFRVGNLFFEYSNYGFQLVHYPERYYADNNIYQNEGYYDEY